MMNDILAEIIREWGILGAVVFGIGWLIWDNKKTSKSRKADSSSIEKNFKILETHITDQVGLVEKKIDLVDHKVDCVEENLHEKINTLADRVDNIPVANVEAMYKRKGDDEVAHVKQIEDLMLLGGKLHETMKKYTRLINTDHIFIGSFHNGNSNLSGIPFCKFDIISECYGDKKVKHDHEFAPVYKDSDILRYGSLFSVIFQSGHILFKVDPHGQNDLAQYEDIIWRRMAGLGIKQMAVKVLKDPDNVPSGFVGCVRYDDKEMNMDMLVQCGTELEHIYSVNKYKMQDAN